MEITLHHFRCHRDGSYSLPGEGLVLISGPSGRGKSSLLNAISYAFYGGIRRPYTHGKQDCRVELHFQGMKVIRTSRPNRLLLSYKGTEYEDDPAQKVIELTLGMNYREFLASSYVVQRKSNSVLSMTPTEQVHFVETLAFSNDQHLEWKKKFKNHVKECRDHQIICETKLGLLKNSLEEAEKILPDMKNIPAQEDLETLEDLEEEEKLLQKELSQSQKTSKKLQRELETLREKEKDLEESQSKIKELEIQIASLKQMRSNSGDEVSHEDIEIQEKVLEEIQEQLDHTKAYNEYTTGLAKVRKLESGHVAGLKKQVKALRVKVPLKRILTKMKKERAALVAQQDEYTKKTTEVETLRIQKKQALAKFKEVQTQAKLRLKTSKAVIQRLEVRKTKTLALIEKSAEKVEEYQHRIAYREIEVHTYQCPSCSTDLWVRGKKLVSSEEKNADPKDSYEGLLEKEKNTLASHREAHQSLEMWLRELEQVKSNLSLKVSKVEPVDLSRVKELEREFVEIEKSQAEIERLQDEIKNKIFPPTIQELRNDLEARKGSFPKKFKPGDPLDILEEKVSKEASKLEELLRIQAERSGKTREIRGLERQLQTFSKNPALKRKLKRKTSTNVETEITKHQTRLSEIAEHMQKVSVTRKYLLYYENLDSINALKENVEKAEVDLKTSERKFRGAVGLQEAGKEAEIRSLEQTIMSINEHAKIYLEKMFEEAIQVRLESFKLTKSRILKTQMNVVVEYRGQVYNSIDELSGGEKQRCELAFLLAVNDMIGSRIILLDECLNNLDAEINMEVLMYLKDLCEGKLVLVVSHEAVKGVFDKTIKI